MHIVKGTKDRTPDFNEYAYSKGSFYRDDSLDKMVAMGKACADTLKNNDYSDAAEWLTAYRRAWVEEILSSYPPHFAHGTKWNYLVQIENDLIRWDASLLAMLSEQSSEHALFRRQMDYAIVDYKGIDPKHRSHHEPEFKAVLEKALVEFRELINSTSENNISD